MENQQTARLLVFEPGSFSCNSVEPLPNNSIGCDKYDRWRDETPTCTGVNSQSLVEIKSMVVLVFHLRVQNYQPQADEMDFHSWRQL